MPWPKPFSGNNDGDKLYLETDKIVKVQILDDEPELYYTHYVDNRTVRCEAPDCSNCLAGAKRIEKGMMRVRDTADNKEKKLCGTAALFLALHESLEMCGGRKGFVFAMKKTGEKAMTRYHVTALPLSTVTSQPEKDEEVPF